MRRLLLAFVPLLLVACGSADRDPLREAADRTTDAGSSRTSWRVVSDGETFTMTGALDYRRRVGSLTWVFPEEVMGSMELRFADDGATYMQIPAELVDDADLDGRWWKLEDKDASDFFAVAIPVPGSRDPRAVVDVLEFAKGSIEVLGTEEVRGASTTHYRATLDAKRLLTRAGTDENEGLLEAYRAADEIPLDVWIDEAGRARRIALDFPKLEDDPAAVITIEFWDFGLDVHVPAPRPDEIADGGLTRIFGGADSDETEPPGADDRLEPRADSEGP